MLAKCLGTQSYSLNTTSSKVAEYHGLMFVLLYISKEYPHARKLVIQGDSKLVVNQVCGEWRVFNPFLFTLHSHIWMASQRFDSVQVVHVKRHLSTLADAAASAGARKQCEDWVDYNGDRQHVCPHCIKAAPEIDMSSNEMRPDANPEDAHPLAILRGCLQDELVGAKFNGTTKQNIVLQDSPLQCLNPSKRHRIQMRQEPSISIEVPLIPTVKHVSLYSQLRPIALIPQLRKLLEDIVLQMRSDGLDENVHWLCAYTSGLQVCDLLLCIALAGARCQEFKIPLIPGVCDIRKSF